MVNITVLLGSVRRAYEKKYDVCKLLYYCSIHSYKSWCSAI